MNCLVQEHKLEMFMLLFCRNSIVNAIHPTTQGMVTETPKS